MEKKFIPQIQVRSDVRSGANTATSSSGGWVNGVWYADMSGVCGGTSQPVPPPVQLPSPPVPIQPLPPNNGGWVGGAWVPDMSGVCG